MKDRIAYNGMNYIAASIYRRLINKARRKYNRLERKRQDAVSDDSISMDEYDRIALRVHEAEKEVEQLQREVREYRWRDRQNAWAREQGYEDYETYEVESRKEMERIKQRLEALKKGQEA